MKIGDIQINEYPLLLAPMEDVTEPSFRFMCKKFGADLMYSEFVASEALIRNVDNTLKKLTVLDYERPVGIQIYGHNIDSMIEATKMVTEAKPDLIDINFGCPVKKIATRGAGAGMLQDIPKMLKMTQEVVKNTHLPVTVKTRLGWDENSKIIVQLAEQLQDCGIKALTIHGRTRNQMYKGQADWTLIGEVKNNQRMKIPIIGNGDIDDPEKAKLMIQKYNIDAIMIGRATYGRPWIFKEIKHFFEYNEIMKPLTLKEKVEIAKLHLSKSLEWKTGNRGIFEMRRHFSEYFKALPNFKEYRNTLVMSLDIQQLFDTLDKIAEIYTEY